MDGSIKWCTAYRQKYICRHIADIALLNSGTSWGNNHDNTVSAIHRALTDDTIERDEVAVIEVEMFRGFEAKLGFWHT